MFKSKLWYLSKQTYISQLLFFTLFDPTSRSLYWSSVGFGGLGNKADASLTPRAHYVCARFVRFTAGNAEQPALNTSSCFQDTTMLSESKWLQKQRCFCGWCGEVTDPLFAHECPILRVFFFEPEVILQNEIVSSKCSISRSPLNGYTMKPKV